VRVVVGVNRDRLGAFFVTSCVLDTRRRVEHDSRSFTGELAMTEADVDTERAILKAWEVQDYQTAATHALEAYGPQILAFLVARLRSVPEAEEAFSMFTEDLWRGLPGFGFRCSTRGWLYALARNAANRHATAPQRRVDRNLTLPGENALGGLVKQLRSTTHAYQRTDVKDAFRLLREKLPVEDQTLLILHVDKKLPWREIAIVLNDEASLPDDPTLEREAARLRKRFERVKADLRASAIQAGLLRG
jgi:RNA polymerase sigma-70 factor (ECF subfamily)